MDDLKIYSKSDSDLRSLLRIVKKFSDDIRMELGLEKCAKISIIKGKMVRSSNINLNEHAHIKELSNTELYKYLRVKESSDTHQKNISEKLKKKYYRRLRMILSTELSSPNKIMAINSLAISVLSYSFGVVNWSKTDVRGIDRKTRKILTMFKMHHPQADTERLYVSRSERGRGLMQVQSHFYTTLASLEMYSKKQTTPLMCAVKAHEESKKSAYSLFEVNKKVSRAFNLNFENTVSQENVHAITAARKTKDIVKKHS